MINDLSYEEWLRELSLFSLERRISSMCLKKKKKKAIGWSKEEEPRLYSVLPSKCKGRPGWAVDTN